MTPFPEVELVTLDRLEVALRNNNMKLLKDGAYKLHEKYHSGHRFEYIDKLKLIYNNVCDNEAIPRDIKDILCPTINDILTDEGLGEGLPEYQTNRVSSLTQLSYNASSAPQETVLTEEPAHHEEKISAFDVFGTKRAETNNSYTQSPFKEGNDAPFQEFKMPETNMASINQNQPVNNNPINNSANTYNQTVTQETIFKSEPMIHQEPVMEQVPISQPEPMVQPEPIAIQPETTNTISPMESYQEETVMPIPEKLEDVAVFYCQDTSNEKVKNILRYRELISKINDEHYSINEILHLISEINVQSNTNILELKNILDQLQINKNKVNLVTNSTSANLIGLMEQGEYSYSLYDRQDDKQINLIPVFGLSNQFICSNCSETYLDKEDKINPLVLQCPKCKSPMFPNFYTANNQEIQMNLEYYNNALLSLVNSSVWVVIHPILEDKVMTNLILSAIKLNSTLKKIYILDKDINVREEFKKRFITLKDDVDVNTNVSALEDFLNSIR